MPPKTGKGQRKATSAANCQDLCSICCQKIGTKDEVLFCSGSCQRHLHRYCASVSEGSYKALTSDGAQPFLCFCCFRAQKDEQVASLLEAIESLKGEINAMKSGSVEPPPVTQSYSEVAKVKTSSAASTSGESTSHLVSRTLHIHENKFNAVL